MVLYPLDGAHVASSQTPSRPQQGISAWEAVEQKQKQPAAAWLLVTQPDHAGLAGDLAARISSPDFPRLEADVILAIAGHDAGWAQFDSHVPSAPENATATGSGSSTASRQSNPRSFLEITPQIFLVAWRDSIAHAESVSAIGGILVSCHFSRLAEHRLRTVEDTSENAEQIQAFLLCEAQRQKRLAESGKRSAQEIEILVDVLQFCDVLSLYLCCGARATVQFSQRFGGHAIRLHSDGELYRTQPALFGPGVSLGVRARRQPPFPHEASEVTIPFLLA
jgi:hypothetical protein